MRNFVNVKTAAGICVLALCLTTGCSRAKQAPASSESTLDAAIIA
jgi:hypothetical protein